MGLIEAFLDAGWEVIFASSAQPTEHSVDLGALGVTTQQIEINDSSFDGWIAEISPDRVIFDRYMIEEQFGWRVEKACPNAVRILDTSDLHCLRFARGEQLKKGGELKLFNEIALREVASIFRSDLTLMISEVEIEVLKEAFQVPAELLFYLPLMVSGTIRERAGFDARENFVIIGNYLHEPNWDGVQWCCREIWPEIRAALPSAELHLYGAYEPDKARQLASAQSGIFLKGRAEDAIETLERYRVNLAPLRFGAGQKGKILDGWMSGTPTVATPVASESMHGSLGWGCGISDDSAVFAREAVQVYGDADLWASVRDQGYHILRERFLTGVWASRLVEVIARVSVVARQGNFVGQMLRHHQHRSTEYMSRWIEAKNRNS